MRSERPLAATGIASLDHLLGGGLPVGALCELTGPECSGRTSVALSFLARMTAAGKVCAWIDVSNALEPASAAAAGVDLERLLWVRCGAEAVKTERSGRSFRLPETCLAPAPAPKKGLHGGRFGQHPRSEVRGLADAVGSLLEADTARAYLGPRCAEPQQKERRIPETAEQNLAPVTLPGNRWRRSRAYDAIEQGLRSADLLMQGGGFSAIVLDLAGVAPAHAARIELSTWYRYRAAAERTQASVLLLSQYACARSSSEVQLVFSGSEGSADETTVFSGMRPQVQVTRRRFATQESQLHSNVVPLRKSPRGIDSVAWQSRAEWAVHRGRNCDDGSR
ncbi:recombinase RecA [Silvibacterium sp.]|uniref:recombinase RecA n=1 Tax=Silvibacterium sp. TaxID=1964179 RepID=UPI0039E565E7